MSCDRVVKLVGQMQVSEFRQRHKLTQEQIASLMGVSARSVARWEESGTPRDRALHLGAIHAHLEIQGRVVEFATLLTQFFGYAGTGELKIGGRRYDAYLFALAKLRAKAE